MTDILSVITSNKRLEIKSLYSDPRRQENLVKLAGEIKRIPLSFSSFINDKNEKGLNGIISEFKRRSPSKGDIAPSASVIPVVDEYQKGGAAACSILTDTRFFGGSIYDLSVARASLEIPILRKDFIIDPIQIYEAFVAGADCILLIASILSKAEIKLLTSTAHDLGMEILFEVHTLEEIDKYIPGIEMIGVNNRKLSTFQTDLSHSHSMMQYLPSEPLKIAESGIKNEEDIKILRNVGYNGFLIGETLMKSGDIQDTLKSFCNAH